MSDVAAGSEGRRPKASKGGNRGNGYFDPERTFAHSNIAAVPKRRVGWEE